jgi:hypothetical protein
MQFLIFFNLINLNVKWLMSVNNLKNLKDQANVD